MAVKDGYGAGGETSRRSVRSARRRNPLVKAKSKRRYRLVVGNSFAFRSSPHGRPLTTGWASLFGLPDDHFLYLFGNPHVAPGCYRFTAGFGFAVSRSKAPFSG